METIIARALAGQPEMAGHLSGLYRYVSTSLPAHEVALVASRTVWQVGATPEYAHSVAVVLDPDWPTTQIDNLIGPESGAQPSAVANALCRMVDELVIDSCVSTPTWDALRERWSQPEVIDLIFLVGLTRVVGELATSPGMVSTGTPPEFEPSARPRADSAAGRGPRPTQPRLPMLSDAALAEFGITRTRNIWRVTGNEPVLVGLLREFLNSLAYRHVIPDDLREVLILRVTRRAGCAYIFGEHTPIGLRLGLTAEQIDGLGDLSRDDSAGEVGIPLVHLADDLSRYSRVTDATWRELAERWSDADRTELLVVATMYQAVAAFVNSAGAPVEDALPAWLGTN